MSLRFEVTGRSKRSVARCGVVETVHGAFQTPAFMPVGTKGTVKGVLPGMVKAVGAEVVLGNTYHLLLRPGHEVVAAMGGLHRFSGWNGPMLTDSGGYQAYSLADINSVDDEGVSFRSVVDGSMIRMTPESSMEIQRGLGADIVMAFDDCPPSVDPQSKPVNQTRLRQAALRDARGRKKGYDHAERLAAANERTVRWLERCKKAWVGSGKAGSAGGQSLFGIVQGGTDLAAREWCMERVCGIDLPGYAIGGVAVGEQSEEIARVVGHTTGRMPEDKPRYLMGVGYERDLVAAVLAGVDMFDCVLPTRNGRNANAFTSRGQIRLRNAKFERDAEVIEAGCDCPACSPSGYGWAMAGESGEKGGSGGFGRGYIRHLFRAQEMLGPILVTLHNLRHFQRLMMDLRGTIVSDDWEGFARRWPVAVAGLGGVLGDKKDGLGRAGDEGQQHA